MASHADAQTIHKGAYVGATDPALVPANKVAKQKLWVDTSGGEGKFILKVRNEANDDWQKVSGLVLGDTPPEDKQVLAFNGDSEQYEPTDLQDIFPALGGDVSGEINAVSVDKLKGRIIYLPPIPESLIETFDSSAATNAAYNFEVSGGAKTQAGGMVKLTGGDSYYNQNILVYCQKTAYDFRNKTIEFQLDNLDNVNHATSWDDINAGYKTSNTTSANPTNWQYWIGFRYKPFTDPTHIEVRFNYWDSNGGSMIETIEISGLATKLRLRDVAGVMNYDVFIGNAWQTIKSYDYAGSMSAAQYITFSLQSNNAPKESAAMAAIITDLYTGADGLTDKKVLAWSATLNRFQDTAIIDLLPPATPLALEGDITGGEKTTVVQKIRGRNVKAIPLPVLVGDDFEDGMLSNLDWYLLGDSDGYANYTEANGRGKFAITNTPYFKGKDIVGKRNIANLSGKEIVFDFNSFGNGDIIVWLGLRDFGANTPAGAGGQYMPDNNFIGFQVTQNGAIKVCFNQTGNGNNINYQNSAVNGIPKKLRMVDNGAGVLSYDVMLVGSEVWQNCYVHDYQIAAVTDKVLALTFAGGQYQAISWELNAVTTTFALSDELADGSILQWSAANARWQDISKDDFLADSNLALAGDITGPSGANNVSKLQGRLLDAPALDNVFGDDFNGSDLADEWTESGSGSAVVTGGKVRLTTPASTYEQQTITSEFHDFTDREIIFYPVTFPAGGGENYALFRLEFADAGNFIYFLARQSDVYVMRAYKTGGVQVGATATGGNSTPSKIRFRHNATTNVLTLEIWNAGTNDYELVVNVDTSAAGWDLTQTRFVAGASTAGGAVFLDLTKVESDIPTGAEEDFVLLFTGGKYQKMTLPDLKAALAALP